MKRVASKLKSKVQKSAQTTQVRVRRAKQGLDAKLLELNQLNIEQVKKSIQQRRSKLGETNQLAMAVATRVLDRAQSIRAGLDENPIYKKGKESVTKIRKRKKTKS